jgi:4-hydroxymandelate oxidase
VYLTGGGDGGRAAPRIGAVRRRLFDGSARFTGDPGHRAELHRYLADLGQPYGLGPPDGAGGHSYGEMAEVLIGELTADGRPVDVLVLAFAVPDVRPGRATATYLSHICPGNPLAFAVCDQGAAAAFTGLRLAGEYLRTGGCRRALLVIVEQAGLAYPPVSPAPVPARHAAVALLLGDSGPPVTAVRQHPNVPPAEVPARLAAELATVDTAGATLVLGAELAGYRHDGAVRVAPAGQPMTGVWWELAEVAAPVVLADYDGGQLCLVATGKAGPSAPSEARAARACGR